MKIIVNAVNVLHVVTNVLLQIPEFTFGGEFYIRVQYCTDAGQTVKVDNVLIPSDIYAQWGTDDQYIINYVLGQLGLTQAQPEPE